MTKNKDSEVGKFPYVSPKEERRIRDIAHRKNKITEQRGLNNRSKTESGWFGWKPKSNVRMSVDEFVEKIFEDEQDFTNVTLIGRKPDLTAHEGFEEMNEYLRMKAFNDYPDIGYLRLDNSNFSGVIAKGIYLPNIYAPSADFRGADFTGAVLPSLYFNGKTRLDKAIFREARLSGISKKTCWSYVDVTEARGEADIIEGQIKPMVFDECDIRRIIGLEKSYLLYENFLRSTLTPKEQGIINDILGRRLPYIRTLKK